MMQMKLLMHSLSNFDRPRYYRNLETSMRGGDFIFDSVQLMYYNCLKLNFRCGGSYIDSPDQIEKKKSNNKSQKYR